MVTFGPFYLLAISAVFSLLMIRFTASQTSTLARVLLSAGLLAVAGGAPGCASRVIEPHVINASREPVEVTAAKPETPALDDEQLNRLAEALDADAWQPNRNWSPLAVWNRRTLGEEPRAEFRWRFHSTAAQEQLDRLDHNAERYLRNLCERNDRVGWNAAVLLCRRNPAACADLSATLERLVNDRMNAAVRGQSSDTTTEEEPPAKTNSVSRATRTAAAEAWVLVLRETQSDPLEALAPAGLLLEDASLDSSVRGELYCQLARWIPPRRMPQLESTLHAAGEASRAPIEIRRDAVLACLHHAAWNVTPADAETPWPETIENGRYDPDATVRRQFAQWVSIAGLEEQAFEALSALVRDRDLLVQREAIIGLGRLNAQAAVEELHRLLERPEEPVREAAIRGLCQLHVAEAARYIDDEAIGVRRALAAALAERPMEESLPLLERLVVDRDPSVQLTAAEICRTWPDHCAVPVLYLGLTEGYLATRQNCFDQLQQRTGTVEVFPLQAARDERAVAARAWLDRHQLMSHVGRVHLPGLIAERSNDRDVNELQRIEVRQKWEQFRQQSGGSVFAGGLPMLAPFTIDEVPALEQILAESNAADQAVLLDVVLPAVSEEYLALKQMTDDSASVRRKAADQLAKHGGEQTSLGPYIVRVLRERLLHEQDRIVWQRAFAAIAPDDTDEAAAIALLALNHQWPDIRQLGCDFITRHPAPERGVWLLPLLGDSNANIQLAAIHAMGLCQNPMVLDSPANSASDESQTPTSTKPEGLRPLLTHSQVSVRRATAIAMSRLGDRQAMQVLVQWSRDPNPSSRIDAIAAMGESDQARFVETLIHLGWTESDATVQLAILRSLLELVPEPRRPDTLSPVMPPGEALKVWMEWWKLQSTAVTTSS